MTLFTRAVARDFRLLFARCVAGRPRGPAPAVVVQFRSGTRALAATSLKRSAAFPDLPTVAESGLPGYDAVLTYGLVAPAGTPRPIVQKLNKVLREVLATDEVKRRIAQEGAEPMSTSPEEYAAVLDREDKKWSAIIKSAGITAK